MPPNRSTRVAIQPSIAGDAKKHISAEKSQIFEFVTITTKPDTEVVKSTSKQVRTHAMRDFLRKKHQKAGTIEISTLNIEVGKPAEYKNKFKLDSWSHKTAAKAAKAREAKEREKKGEKEIRRSSPTRSTSNFILSFQQPSLQSLSVSGSIDPFDSLSIKLEPRTQRLFYYYSTAYSMNSVAINAEGNLFSYIKTDTGLFHSLMYLVALHHDLKQGVSDSSVTLHHGGEAFKILNQRLGDPSGIFSDMTIGAVAMLVNKENLNGRYSLSKMHMEGLKYMIAKRGGVQNLAGVFQRIVTWPDFCFANVWNCQPGFPRLHHKPATSKTVSSSNSNLLRPSHLFGSVSPIVSIFTALRSLSTNLDPDHIASINRLQASTTIYNVEYDLLLLNKVSANDPEPSKCIFSFEAIPLKTAAHIYLWLVIRELPATSELLYLMVQRLKDSLEVQIPGWWNGIPEREMWLLWVLFLGAIAANGRDERLWFVGELAKVCQSLGIWSLEGLREVVMKILWQEAFCEVRCAEIWRDVCLVNEASSVRLEVESIDVI